MHHLWNKLRLPSLAAVMAILLGLVPNSHATERRFTASYETTTTPKGTWEIEQQFFWETGSGFDTFAFREELEYGITDRLQLGIYLFDWEHAREEGERSTKWEGSGIELVYQLTDPNKSFIGSALYGEVIVSDEKVKLEGKLLLQKNFGPLMVVYNAIIEAEWEDHYKEDVGVLEQTLGVSYQLNPSFSVGFEAKHEVALEHWEEAGDHAVFVGPNVSFRAGRFFGAFAGLFRVSDASGEPNFELNTIVGFHF